MLNRYQIEDAAKAIRMLGSMIREQYKPRLGFDGAYGPATQDWVGNVLVNLDNAIDELVAAESTP